MATYVVCTEDGAQELAGVVRDVGSGRVSRFDGPEALVTALSGGHGPGPGSPEDPVDGPGLLLPHEPSRERALTPAQLRMGYLQAGRGAA